MDIRKMALALALPLALGTAGCQTSKSSTAGGTATAPTSTGAEGGAVATPSQTGQTTPGEATQGGTSHGTSGTATARDDGTLTGEHGASTGMGSDLKGHASDQVMMGTVSSVSSETLSIASDMGAARTLHVVPETIITVDGRDGGIADIKEGEQIRASFNEQDGRQIAVKIEAGPTMGSTGTERTTDAPPADTATPSEPSTSPGSTGTTGGYDTSGTRR